MRARLAYCGIRNRNVYVSAAEEPSETRDAKPESDLEIMCIKYGYGAICTGDFCPNFHRGAAALGVRPALG